MDKTNNTRHSRNVGDIVWACAYCETSTKDGRKSYAKPTKGILANSRYNTPESIDPNANNRVRFFVPIRKDGKGYVWSQAVISQSRFYADTEEDSAALYNRQIDNAIKRHQAAIDELTASKI